MDYEKRYNEIVKAVKELRDVNPHDEGINEWINDKFPELKESEDERIRKALLGMVHDTTGDSLWVDYNVHKEDAIAWLEKQGEHDNFRNKIQIGDKVTRNQDGVLVNLSQLNRVAKKDEKQGEKKPATMSLDEAIEHCKEKSCGNSECALEHKQLEKWLTELKELKELRIL